MMKDSDIFIISELFPTDNVKSVCEKYLRVRIYRAVDAQEKKEIPAVEIKYIELDTLFILIYIVFTFTCD